MLVKQNPPITQVRVLAAFKFSFEKIIKANVNPQKIIGKINLFIFKTKKLLLNKNITNISLCWTYIINVKVEKNKV